MAKKVESIPILIAEDDADDRKLIEEAFVECNLGSDLRFVMDGEELLDYLFQRGSYSDAAQAPTPGLILLDLNMPKVDGREALKVIKGDEKLRRIRTVVLTTSKAEEDVIRSYDLGVDSFIIKPVTFDGLVDVIRTLEKYWLQIVKLSDS